MFLYDDTELLDHAYKWGFLEIKEAIIACHRLLYRQTMRMECSIEYALGTAFGKGLTSFEETILLLVNGYSDGAFAIARTLYENYIIALFLNKHYQEYDSLLQKYFDNYNRESASCEKAFHEGILHEVRNTGIENDNSRYLIRQLNDIISENNRIYYDITNKYPSVNLNKDYWWASEVKGISSFGDIQNDAIPPLFKAHYKYACSRVHSSHYSNIQKTGINTDDIIFSATFTGYERPLIFSLVVFKHFLVLFSSVVSGDCTEIINLLEPVIERFNKHLYGIG